MASLALVKGIVCAPYYHVYNEVTTIYSRVTSVPVFKVVIYFIKGSHPDTHLINFVSYKGTKYSDRHFWDNFNIRRDWVLIWVHFT